MTKEENIKSIIEALPTWDELFAVAEKYMPYFERKLFKVIENDFYKYEPMAAFANAIAYKMTGSDLYSFYYIKKGFKDSYASCKNYAGEAILVSGEEFIALLKVYLMSNLNWHFTEKEYEAYLDLKCISNNVARILD